MTPTTARRTGAIGIAVALLAALTPSSGSAAASAFPDFCPWPGSIHYYNPPITSGPQTLELGWYASPKDPVVEENVPFTATVSRPDGSQAHSMTLTAWSRSNPNDGYEVYGTDDRPYGPADAGRWKLHGDGSCADIYFFAFAQGRIADPVPTATVVAGSTVTVGSTVRGWNAGGVEAPVAGMLVDIDRSPNVDGSPRTGAAQARTDSSGRARAAITVYSNTRIYQDNVLEATSRHDPEAVRTPTVLVRKRILRTVNDTTPAVGQYVKITGTVYPSKATQPVNLQRWNGSTFVTITPGRTSSSTGGAYTFYYKPTTRGTHALRVSTPYDAWHVTSASANIYLTAH